MDFGDNPDTAMHWPRIDASEGALVIGDTALDPAVREALAARFEYVRQHRLTMPMKFACPSIVQREGDVAVGATEIGVVWADAVQG